MRREVPTGELTLSYSPEICLILSDEHTPEKVRRKVRARASHR